MKLRRKLFSGYSEVSPSGVGYQSAQALSDYVLVPVSESLDYVDKKIPIEPVKTKTNRISRAIRPIISYIEYRKNRKIDK